MVSVLVAAIEPWPVAIESHSKVLDNLENDDFDDLVAEGSDDDLGMDTDYTYDSDNLLEGIISKKFLILKLH